MIAQLVFATVLASSGTGVGTDPLEAALDYADQMEITVEATEAAEEAEEAAELARQQAIDRTSREADRSPTRYSVPESNGYPYLMTVIAEHESHWNPRAYSPTGCSDENGTWSCGGRWQLSEQYASTWAAEAGFPGMSSHAEDWPVEIQDAVARYKFFASDPDGTLWCAYTDYC